MNASPPASQTTFDALIVGAGFSGLTLAERLCTRLGWRCLVVDRRDHIGGNAADHIDGHGVLVHSYGPHYFRTNSARIREYLSQFTAWHPVEYTILSHASGRYWPFPINLNTFEAYLGRPSTSAEMEAWLAHHRVAIDKPANSEEVILSQVGREFYELFFRGYTRKQWRRDPRELDASVCGRIPLRTIRDNRYFNDSFQALPQHGYSRLFENMVRACGELLDLRLKTSYQDVLPQTRFRRLVFTGPIDEFFDHRFGPLPYRSLRFEPQSFTPEQLRSCATSAPGYPVPKGFFQPAVQVNYPGDEPFTRIVEVKHATGQVCENTTIVREYPADFGPGDEPYYPIPAPDTAAIYRRYEELADHVSTNPGDILPTGSGCEGISFIGRLATYRYYNMDQVVGMALTEFDKLAGG